MLRHLSPGDSIHCACRASLRFRRHGLCQRIQTEDLTKTFGDVLAVDGLDLTVERGEVFGLLGPDGAGKSTIMRMLIDALRPTRGSATIDGQAVGDPEVRRRIGYMPGDLRMPGRYTSQELFDFHGSLRGGVDRAVESDLAIDSISTRRARSAICPPATAARSASSPRFTTHRRC